MYKRQEHFLKKELQFFPSIWFGYEQAKQNLKHGGNLYFPTEFTEGKESIKINGLIWMGNADFMQKQIKEKLDLGFSCIKLKIGVNWTEEKEIIKQLRNIFSADELEIRVDANGAFAPKEALEVLHELAELNIHSIEQPIKAFNKKEGISEQSSANIAEVCAVTPTPIALDEELIGVITYEDKNKLLNYLKPQYIILKPSLVGGFSGCDEWIAIADQNKIGWWITSALESNLGLNAIAQYTFTKKNPMPQGLGTGSLFTNNFESPLELKGDQMFFKG